MSLKWEKVWGSGYGVLLVYEPEGYPLKELIFICFHRYWSKDYIQNQYHGNQIMINLSVLAQPLDHNPILKTTEGLGS